MVEHPEVSGGSGFVYSYYYSYYECKFLIWTTPNKQKTPFDLLKRPPSRSRKDIVTTLAIFCSTKQDSANAHKLTTVTNILQRELLVTAAHFFSFLFLAS